MTDRRLFLKTLAVAGAASLVPDLSVFGQTVNRLSVRGGAIDVHHHFNAPGQSTVPRPWTIQNTLDQMEKFGIGVAILSPVQNGAGHYDNTPKGRDAIRRTKVRRPVLRADVAGAQS